jgi:hypothetical protein
MDEYGNQSDSYFSNGRCAETGPADNASYSHRLRTPQPVINSTCKHLKARFLERAAFVL